LRHFSLVDKLLPP
jgi:hypothetical protein